MLLSPWTTCYSFCCISIVWCQVAVDSHWVSSFTITCCMRCWFCHKKNPSSVTVLAYHSIYNWHLRLTTRTQAFSSPWSGRLAWDRRRQELSHSKGLIRPGYSWESSSFFDGRFCLGTNPVSIGQDSAIKNDIQSTYSPCLRLENMFVATLAHIL